MSTTFLATKLYIPPPRSKIVLRPRLVERLKEGLHCKFTLISAPAGFGKTTLVSEWVQITDLKDVTPHTLRHTFAKSLIDSGVSLDKVATLLGHSNLNTTRIYTTPGVQDLEDAIGELDNF